MAQSVALVCFFLLFAVSLAADKNGIVLTIEAPDAMDTTSSANPKGYLNFESPPQHTFGSVIPEELKPYVKANNEYGGAVGPQSGGHFLRVDSKVVITFPHLRRLGGPVGFKYIGWYWGSVDDANYVKFWSGLNLMGYVNGSLIKTWINDNDKRYYGNPARGKNIASRFPFGFFNAYFLGREIMCDKIEFGTTVEGHTMDVDNVTYGNYTGGWTGEYIKFLTPQSHQYQLYT